MFQYEKYPYPDIHGYVDHNQKYLRDDYDFEYVIDIGKDYSGNILLLGCGTMEATILGTRLPKAKITAYDYSQKSLDLCSGILVANNITNVTLLKRDIQKPFDGKYPVIVANCVLHHLPKVEECLKNVAESLKPSGVFVGSVYKKGTERSHISETIREYGFHNLDQSSRSISRVTDVLINLPKDHPSRQWFDFYQKTDIEIVDTWLNSYFTEYTKEEMENLLLTYFVSPRMIDVRENQDKVVFGLQTA